MSCDRFVRSRHWDWSPKNGAKIQIVRRFLPPGLHSYSDLCLAKVLLAILDSDWSGLQAMKSAARNQKLIDV